MQTTTARTSRAGRASGRQDEHLFATGRSRPGLCQCRCAGSRACFQVACAALTRLCPRRPRPSSCDLRLQVHGTGTGTGPGPGHCAGSGPGVTGGGGPGDVDVEVHAMSPTVGHAARARNRQRRVCGKQVWRQRRRGRRSLFVSLSCQFEREFKLRVARHRFAAAVTGNGAA
eukprot:3005464-Rhodomonas_salina.2